MQMNGSPGRQFNQSCKTSISCLSPLISSLFRCLARGKDGAQCCNAKQGKGLHKNARAQGVKTRTCSLIVYLLTSKRVRVCYKAALITSADLCGGENKCRGKILASNNLRTSPPTLSTFYFSVSTNSREQRQCNRRRLGHFPLQTCLH